MRAIGFSKYQWVITEKASKDNLRQNRAKDRHAISLWWCETLTN